MATPQLCNYMERQLLEETTIEQARIVDLAQAGDAKHDYVVAIVLAPSSESSANDVDDDAFLRATRKSLVRKMRPFGGKDVVPRKWTRQASLPVAPDGTVDDATLVQLLLGDGSVRKAKQPTLVDKVMEALATVLGVPVEQLDMSKSFKENGGDSFSAIQVTKMLMADGISLRVPDISWAETIGELPSRVVSRHPGFAPPQPTREPGIEIYRGQRGSVAPIRV
jgi:hypothetical protein